jgi:hypothetical protein
MKPTILFVIALALAVLWLAGASPRALAAVPDAPNPQATAQPTVDVPVVVATYAGPDKCKACHAKEAAAWADAPHANAAKVTAFVEAWVAAKSPRYCLACHTTSYNPNTGEFAYEGVTCESCHGAYVDGHPMKAAMTVDKSPEACGTCHQSTLVEWKMSPHGQNNVGCVTCHDVHGGTIKVGDSVTLCGKCHQNEADNFSHNGAQTGGPSCADCHIGQRSGDPTEGHANTGHTFAIAADTCSRCHKDELHRVNKSVLEPTPGPTPEPAAPEGAAPLTVAANAVNVPGTALPVVASGTLLLALGLVIARVRNGK